jgi:hypothetical protein
LTLGAVSDVLSNFDSEEAMMEFKNHAAGIQTNPTTIEEEDPVEKRKRLR